MEFISSKISYQRKLRKVRAASSSRMMGVLILAILVSAGTSFAVLKYLPDSKLFPSVAKQSSTITSSPAAEKPAKMTKPVSPEELKSATQTIEALNDALVKIAQDVEPSVVTIFTEKVLKVRRVTPFASPFFKDPFFNQFFGFGSPHQGKSPHQPQQPYEEQHQEAMGSGVIVSKDGYILTNNHVISDTDKIRVRILDGKTYKGKIVGADPQTDIAVVKIEADNLKPVVMGDSDTLRVGEIVLAVGSPMSPNLAHTVTQGIVSAKGRSNVGLAEYEDFIQTDATINPGNSGGALVNGRGELVGINTAIVTKSGGSMGIGFAVPVNMARLVMKSLIEKGEVIRSWLGVYAQDLNEDLAKAMGLSTQQGVLIANIQKQSPAEKAGLKAGDVITELNSERLIFAADLRNKVSISKPGSIVKLKILRDHKEKSISVKLERLPTEQGPSVMTGKTAEKTQELLGFKVANLTPNILQQFHIDSSVRGVAVVDLNQSSTAALAGVQEGDVIESVNRRKVQNVLDFVKATHNIKPGQTLLLKLYRQSGTMFLAFTLQSS